MEVAAATTIRGPDGGVTHIVETLRRRLSVRRGGLYTGAGDGADDETRTAEGRKQVILEAFRKMCSLAVTLEGTGGAGGSETLKRAMRLFEMPANATVNDLLSEGVMGVNHRYERLYKSAVYMQQVMMCGVNDRTNLLSARYVIGAGAGPSTEGGGNSGGSGGGSCTWSVMNNKFLEQLYYGCELLKNTITWELNHQPMYSVSEATGDGAFQRFMPEFAQREYKDVHLFIRHILRICRERKYGRVRHSMIYEMHTVVDRTTGVRHATYTWVKVMSIEEFVYMEANPTRNAAQFVQLLSSASNIPAAIRMLCNGNFYELPEIERDRHLFSYRNGLFDAKRQHFHAFSDGPLNPAPYACKFFDQDFNKDWLVRPVGWTPTTATTSSGARVIGTEWYQRDTIPTPTFQRILEFQFNAETGSSRTIKAVRTEAEARLYAQQYAEHVRERQLQMMQVIFMFYACIGRCLYNTREMDNLEFVPFLQGVAGSGKSTLLDVVRAFFTPDDIGCLNNDSSDKFPLMDLYDKMVIIAPEVKKNFNFPQTDLQTMVTGEAIAVHIKNKGDKMVDHFLPPVIMAGNEFPNLYKDPKGAMARRMLVFLWDRIVHLKDTTLRQSLESEIGALLVKCNAAYHVMLREIGGRDIWSYVPQFFIDGQKQLRESANVLDAFLDSTHFVMSGGGGSTAAFGGANVIIAEKASDYLYIREDVFLQAFTNYCRQRHDQQPAWKPDLYQTTFDMRHLTIAELSPVDFPYPRSAGAGAAKPTGPDDSSSSSSSSSSTNTIGMRPQRPPATNVTRASAPVTPGTVRYIVGLDLRDDQLT